MLFWIGAIAPLLARSTIDCNQNMHFPFDRHASNFSSRAAPFRPVLFRRSSPGLSRSRYVRRMAGQGGVKT
ncbi:hypothetical protein B0T22DRAFT_455982 [Podospora appendiculata]|uniref:Uncharacterized protein n=1 Tax=Podospora appendiculata TaxID=314037 RepID=A0AAE1CI96_9PEZI|nr:hypothetical protein B0T22DRAFT_455982 [Podospora appendiculata]